LVACASLALAWLVAKMLVKSQRRLSLTNYKEKFKHPGYKININRFAIIYIAMYLLSIVCVGIFYFVFGQT
jgi:hypothetical protein